MKIKMILALSLFLLGSETLFAEMKVAKDVSYGPDERNVMDIYWNSDFKNAPIVFTIHGGGFRNGSKAYCNPEMQKLFLDKGCVVVSPNYRLLKQGEDTTIQDCAIDCAMAVAYMQANAEKYGGDPKRIVSTGGSAGGYLSAAITYKKDWDWPTDAKYKPEKLNIIGWYGDSPYLPNGMINQVTENDPPGFMIYGQREHPGTPKKMGHDMQAALKNKGIWSKMFYVENGKHVPGKIVLINSRTRDPAVGKSFSQFIDWVCYQKDQPEGNDVITVKQNR